MGSSWKTTRTDDLQGSVGYQICYSAALQSFTAFIWYNNHNSIFTFTTTRLVPNRTTANPMISKNCLQYWYPSQRKTSWIKWLEQLCQALKIYPWNWLGALIETLLIISVPVYMHQLTEDETILRSSLYYPNKRPWKQLWNKFMNIHIDCSSRLVSCKLISWARSAPQKHKQVKYWYHSHISRHICVAPNC